MKKAVCFLKVQTVQEKLALICSTVAHHFHRGERWMLFADGARALEYLNELLWRFPADSFLPHSVADQEVDERIVLTNGRRNLNRATLAFSFLNEPLIEPLGFETIFELEDLTAPEKQSASLQRREIYLCNGFEAQ